MIGALRRNVGIEMHFVPSAKAIHSEQLKQYDVAHQRSHIMPTYLIQFLLTSKPDIYPTRILCVTGIT